MYCIAGFRKVKSAGELASLANHNNRIKLTINEAKRIDKDRACLNSVLVNPLDVDPKTIGSLGKKIAAHYKSNNVKIRADSVLAVDLMLTASPAFFGKWRDGNTLTIEGKQKIDDWVKCQLAFVKGEFGEQAVKYAVLHLDESTPHIHFVVTPEETKVLQYKNQYGLKERVTTSLNANRWSPPYWKKFLTRYAKANAAYGLKRGIMESESDNVPLKDFMKMVSQAARTDYTKAISEVIEEIAGNLSFMNSKAAVEKVLYEKLLPKLNPMLKSNKALKKLFSTSREGEYKALELLKKNLETELIAAKAERKALAEKAEYYGKGLKIRMQLESEISDLRAISKGQSEIISKLEAENFGLKQKQLSKTALNRTSKPGQIY